MCVRSVSLAAAPTPRSGAVLLGASSSPTVAEAPECRICLEAEGGSGPLIRTACACAGTLSYAHLACLQTWILTKRPAPGTAPRCELCKTEFRQPLRSQLEACLKTVEDAADARLAAEREFEESLAGRCFYMFSCCCALPPLSNFRIQTQPALSAPNALARPPPAGSPAAAALTRPPAHSPCSC